MNYNSYHTIGKIGIIIGIIFRIFYLPKSIDLNLFDTILHIKKITGMFKNKFLFYFIIALYFIASIVLITISIVSRTYDYPYIDYLSFENRKDYPFIKSTYRQTPDVPYGFCRTITDDGLNTVDLSMLSTLPRLYGITDNNVCYLKPKFRGVFNSTMKYIFGSNYSSKNIRIYCWAKMHDPYLVITSEENYMNSLNSYSEDDVIIINNQESFEPITSEEYFNDTLHLCDSGLANSECKSLQKCIETGNSQCDDEWSLFTNKYWQAQSEDYNANMKGLEQYQIAINEDFIFQPGFIFNNTLLSGTHYIVGGGVENQWGYASMIENLLNVVYIDIFGSFLPLFNFVYNIFQEIFNTFSEFALTFIYIESISSKEMLEFSNLINHFNISYNNLYFVGHSLSATTMKELSFLTNISGIAFEGSKGIGYAQFRVNDSLALSSHNLNNIANIYSGSSLLTGEDTEFRHNGALPNKFYNPNVYDTACLTMVTCSTTEQYVPYCKQVLNQNGEDPLSNYNELLDAFYNQ